MKSKARLLCPEHLVSSFAGWDTQYVQTTCKVLAPNSPTEVLGAILGDAAAASAGGQKVVTKVAQLHQALGTLDHPATELVLTRRCADVAKLSYTLRCAGDRVADNVLEQFDTNLRAALEGVLAGPLKDTSWWQATTGVREGGLGFREAVAVSLPALLASRITARPLALEMARHAQQAGMVTEAQFVQAYDDRTKAAFERLRAKLPDQVADELREIAVEGAEAAATRWQHLQQGTAQGGGAGQRGVGRRPGQGLVLEPGEEDPESPDAAGRTGPGLQAQFTKLVDQCVVHGLRLEHNSAESWTDVRRLDELGDKSCNHDWLWALCPQHGPTLQTEEFVEAVRLRLGAGGPTEPVPCRLCKDGVLDSGGSHALQCSLAEATRGHNAVKNELLRVAKACDSSAEAEPLGLIPSNPALRPADVFTSAATPGRLSALDVGICSPEAAAAGADCTESMRQRKLHFYAQHLTELEAQNIVYKPLTWSCFGRPHAAVTEVLHYLCKQTARRRGLVRADVLQRRAEAAITVEIWRRAARMTFACWPREAELADESEGH